MRRTKSSCPSSTMLQKNQKIIIKAKRSLWDLEIKDFFKYKDHLIEVWYDETTSSPMAWNAFIKGFGTYSEYGRERVIHVAKRKIDGLC